MMYHYQNVKELHYEFTGDTLPGILTALIYPARNVTFTIKEASFENMTMETDLFDESTMLAYAKKNAEEILSEDEKKYFSEYRGGNQGDYSSGMKLKINNVIDCLVQHPESKRAVIAIDNSRWAHHDTDRAKCCRELHFYLDRKLNLVTGLTETKLSCTGFFRAQAVDIMPKNFYMVAYFMEKIRKGIEETIEEPIKIGSYTHFVTTLVKTRYD